MPTVRAVAVQELKAPRVEERDRADDFCGRATSGKVVLEEDA